MKKNVIPALIAAILMGGINVAFAQEPPEGRPPFPGGPDGPPPFGRGDGGRFGGPRPITVATVPTNVLTHYLKLSADQQKRVAAIGMTLRVAMPRPPAPPQNGNEEGNRPPRRSREEREAHFLKMKSAEAKATKEIMVVLSPAQKSKLPQLMSALSALQADHIALSAVTRLNLTNSQIKRLAAAGKSATHEVVVSDFTATQNEIADANRRERGGPGSPFGGPGGPPPGGPDGPPPGGPPF